MQSQHLRLAKRGAWKAIGARALACDLGFSRTRPAAVRLGLTLRLGRLGLRRHKRLLLLSLSSRDFVGLAQFILQCMPTIRTDHDALWFHVAVER